MIDPGENVLINSRFLVREYTEHYEFESVKFTEIYDIRKNIVIQLTDNKNIVIRDEKVEYAEKVRKIDVPDLTFRTLSGHTISIIRDESISITDRKAKKLSEILEILEVE